MSWRQTFRLAALAPAAVPVARALVREMKTTDEEATMIATSATAKRAGDSRKLATLVRHIERSVDSALGADEAAARVRRYVSEHDAPADDRVAFGRLCTVIFAQGIGYEAVAARADGFAEAFSGYRPDAVAGYDERRVESLLSAPIVRNAAKIQACVENARRWVALAKTHGTYLGRIASAAAADDPATGWTALSGLLRSDFVHLGESTAGQVLKHLGFFTAFEGRTNKRPFPNKSPTRHGLCRAFPIMPKRRAARRAALARGEEPRGLRQGGGGSRFASRPYCPDGPLPNDPANARRSRPGPRLISENQRRFGFRIKPARVVGFPCLDSRQEPEGEHAERKVAQKRQKGTRSRNVREARGGAGLRSDLRYAVRKILALCPGRPVHRPARRLVFHRD